MWPKERVAFLVIHGIGEQSPFETLDSFVRNFLKTLKKNNDGCDIAVKHHIRTRADNGKEWTENFISLVKDGQSECAIDFYEYYWAYKMEREITFQELVDWLIKTSDGAGKFYNENEKLVKKYEVKRGDYWYLKHLGYIMRALAFFKMLKIPYFDYVIPFIKPFLTKASQAFVDYMGDVAIYTTTDVKSKHHHVRNSILTEAVNDVKALIDNQRYKNVIIAGHSLGSVIAYDTLNRVNHALNLNQEKWKAANKICGLVTFGSPLDKTAFFFREHTSDSQYVRRQILDHFHSFKGRDLNLTREEVKVEDPISPLLDNQIRWINFWDEKDPVCGHLDFYVVDDNIKVDMKAKYGVAHNAYWGFEEMYEKICRFYF